MLSSWFYAIGLFRLKQKNDDGGKLFCIEQVGERLMLEMDETLQKHVPALPELSSRNLANRKLQKSKYSKYFHGTYCLELRIDTDTRSGFQETSEEPLSSLLQPPLQ